jgi:hypothetical protein
MHKAVWFIVLLVSLVRAQNLLDTKQHIPNQPKPVMPSPVLSVPFKTWSSVLIPGLGQALNHKYWKIPILYGGFIGLGNTYQKYQDRYQVYKSQLQAEYDDDPNTQNTSGLSKDALMYEKNKARYLRDYCAAGIGLLYLINIIDAHVDAHLFTYDVSDDLSFRPVLPNGMPGLCITFKP